MSLAEVLTFPVTFPMNTVGRLRAALIDGHRRERTVLLALAAYVLLWAVYGTIAKSSQGLHSDMVEVIAWSRDLSMGYLKHPPLAAALVWVWFSVMPFTEFTYYLLAMLMPALALWFAWRLSADYLDVEKRIAGLALLMLIPFFNFHALKFNVNTVLLPLWAATTFWFLRAYTTRSALYAALAGFGAALCMLGKYWSAFLLAGLIVAALVDKRRAGYFKSPAPWITVAVGLIAMAPHLYWLQQHNFPPFTYALTVHGEKPFAGTIIAALGYLLGSLGYVALPVILVLAAARPGRARLADMIWPQDGDRRLAATALWTAFFLPALIAVASGSEINSLWSIASWTLLSVLLLSSPQVTIKPADTRRLLFLAGALPLGMLLASPLIAILEQRASPPSVTAQARLLATEVERIWHQATPQALRYVGGDEGSAYGVSLYAVDRPRALPGMTPPDASMLRRAGMMLLCLADDSAVCMQRAMHTVGDAVSRKIEIDIADTGRGKAAVARRYIMIVVPPRH